MRTSDTLKLVLGVALLAPGGVALADVAAKNTYYAPGGVIVKASDAAGGAICSGFNLVPGVTTDAVIFYPGAPSGGVGGTNMTLVSPSTPDTARSAGSTTAYTCRAGTLTSSTVKGVTKYKWTPAVVPASGLDGAVMPFACFLDSQKGGAGDGGKVFTPNFLPVATASITFHAAQTHNGSNSLSTATTEAITVGSNTCTYETDATWYAR